MFCEVSRYVKSSLTVVVVGCVKICRVAVSWNLLFAVSVTEFVTVLS